MIGVRVEGLSEAERGVDGIRRATDDALKRDTEASATFINAALRVRMSAPQRFDPFFGAMGTAGDGLATRSKEAINSIAQSPAIKFGDGWQAAVGSNLPKLRLLEGGGQVTPTSGQYLRIPLTAAQTLLGVDRWLNTSIRAIPGAFLKRSLGGNLFAVQPDGQKRTGKGQHIHKGSLTFLYLLVRAVTLKPHRSFQRAQEDAAPKITALFGQGIRTALEQANAA